MKPSPNHSRYISVLRGLTPEQRLSKAFELSEFTRSLLREGLKNRHPNLSETELEELYLASMAKAQSRIE
jgi:hypothetical protein